MTLKTKTLKPQELIKNTVNITIQEKTIIFSQMLNFIKRIYDQQTKDSHTLLSWRTPEIERIRKGNPLKLYKLRVKVSVNRTINKAKGGKFVLHPITLPGNSL